MLSRFSGMFTRGGRVYAGSDAEAAHDPGRRHFTGAVLSVFAADIDDDAVRILLNELASDGRKPDWGGLSTIRVDGEAAGSANAGGPPHLPDRPPSTRFSSGYSAASLSNHSPQGRL